MNNGVDMGSVQPASTLQGEDCEDTALLRKMFDDASGFLRRFRWCRDIKESYFGIGVGGIVAVFLFRIDPSEPDVDQWLWIIVGDLPPAYLVVDKSPNPVCALHGYIQLMEEWVVAARAGTSVDALIPVNAPPTLSNAEALGSRLRFITDNILGGYLNNQ